jgi:hypothetical protein
VQTTRTNLLHSMESSDDSAIAIRNPGLSTWQQCEIIVLSSHKCTLIYFSRYSCNCSGVGGRGFFLYKKFGVNLN